MSVEIKQNAYIASRIIECLSIAAFIFGFLWEGTELLQLSAPEFMMLYGGTGAVISEILARIFHKQLKKNLTTETRVETKE